MTRAMRCCTRCSAIAFNDEELKFFVRNKRSLHGRMNLCKACNSKYQVRHRSTVQAEVDKVKGGECVDCSGTFNPVAMDFDHIRGEKQWTIAAGIRLG